MTPAEQTRRNSTSGVRDDERGYALVALLAMMSIMALFALALAPQVQQQTQREREKEAIFRGEQVADAIRSYYLYRGQQGANGLPTSMDQLLEGIQLPGRTKRLQILRPSAARDPLSKSGEWRLVGPTSEDFGRFVRDLTIYSGGVPPTVRMPGLTGLIRVTNILDTESEAAPGGENTSPDVSGPFLAVTSRSRRDSVIAYYGIERHDQWIFTPMFR